MNRVRGLWPPLALFAGGLVAARLCQRARRGADGMPPTVRRLLRDPQCRAELAGIVARAARYANLTRAERRSRALEFARAALTARGLAVTDPELVLLIERLYGRLKRTHPGTIAPEPMTVE